MSGPVDPHPGSDPNQGGQYPQYGGGQQYGGQQYGGQQYGGQYPQYGANYGAPQPSPKNGFGIAALIVGIISILALWTFGFGILLGLVAIVLGFLGRGRAKRGEATNRGMSTVGIVLGVVGIIIGAMWIGLWVWVFNEAGGFDYTSCIASAGDDSAKIEQCNDDLGNTVGDRFDVSITPLPTN